MIRAADRWWWGHVIRRADVVDLAVVNLQLPGLSTRAAIRHYVRGGFRDGFTLNPLFSEQMVSMQLSDAGRVPALYAYLVNDRQRVQTSLLWDAPEHSAAAPESRDDAAGPLGHAWRRLLAGGPIDFGHRDHRTASRHAEILDLVARALVLSRKDDLTSIPRHLDDEAVLVWQLAEDERDIALSLKGAASATDQLGARLVIGVSGDRPDAWVPAVAMSDACGGVVTTLRDAGAARRFLSSIQESMAAGSRLTVRGPGVEVTVSSILLLARATGAELTSPLVLDADGVLINAGYMHSDGALRPLLAGHPAEDACALGREVRVDAISTTTFAQTITPGRRPESASVLTDSWIIAAPHGRSGLPREVLAVARRAPRHAEDLLASIGLRRARESSTRLERAPALGHSETPRLRWAIKTAAPAGLGAEWWGDTHFARGLAAALRELGQDVVIDSIGARDRPSHHLDDVELVLRGPEAIAPHTHATSLMWIISHPDQIAPDETAQFDHVFAASESWARYARPTLGAIETLLQCTDARQFHPTGVANSDRIVFVGTARGIPRPSVIEPIRAGFEVDVIGPDWTGWIPASSVVATGISNTELPALYESAHVVLNDHWPAMQRAGFVSNRLFDVVAAGGRAISDSVDGIDELFGGMVQTYETIPELLTLLSRDPHELFPQGDIATAISRAVREQHSFDARAATLLRTALAIRAGSDRI
ncbi:hypothetical protein N3K63_00550 [Microbacterium sp. W1N]|uniref:glycosyltransferase family protein n=1 Tax=Microbacterium festucae TaxID=2977531 RepID=UPI0021C103CF|nr:glycosyltransferase [Microbacterium festucae]MCT9818765.1 hypothetical protein [Microbacterium festucae]